MTDDERIKLLNEVAAMLKVDETKTPVEGAVAGMALVLHLLDMIDLKEIEHTGKPLMAGNWKLIDLVTHSLRSGLQQERNSRN